MKIHHTVETASSVVTDDPRFKHLADYVVCASLPARAEHTPRVETICADCGIGVYHQPGVPERAMPLCRPCFLRKLDAEEPR